MAMKNIVYEVPRNDKEIFVEPSIDRIPDLVLTNRGKMLDYRFRIAGIPFQTLRDKTRSDIVYKSLCYTRGIKSLFCENQQGVNLYVRNRSQNGLLCQQGDDKSYARGMILDYEAIKNIPIIQTGHEPVFYYPGIWIKNHLVHYISEKLKGLSVNMIVDNDACNTGFMYMPDLSQEPAVVQKVMLVEGKYKMAYEEIEFDDVRVLMQFREEVLALFKNNASCQKAKMTNECIQTLFEEFMDAVIRYYNRGCVDMAGLLTAARCALEKEFQVDNLEVPVSWICDTDGFYYFLLHIIYDSIRFAGIYNDKLAEYRHNHKIRSKANPLPDLMIMENLIEIPFWVWKTGGIRSKCFVLNEKESIKVTDGSDSLVTLGKNEEVIQHISRLKALVNAGIKLRPRAITTSMFSRLLFSDVFIHGIGGAKYDIITDEIIKEYFGVEPPTFVTISAALFLPLEAFDLDIGDLQRRQHDLKDMRYNPERYASKEIQRDMGFMQKVEEKQALVREMTGCSKNDKKRYFNRIKELNSLIFLRIHDEVLREQEKVRVLHNKLMYNEVVKFREYPIYLYPMPLLQEYFLNVFSGA
jgi:hypothetical protein